MPELHRYRLFISHAWQYSDDYTRLINLLDVAPYFNYANYSVPRYDPLHCSQSDLKEQLREQIRPVEVVVILSGMYVAYSGWIQFEIDYASSLNKSILGIKLWGSERTPDEVYLASNEIVGWNTDSILSAIRRLS